MCHLTCIVLPEIVFQKHRTALGSRDSKSIIDKLWLEQVSSGGGLKRLQDKLEEVCLPKKGKAITIAAAAAELEKLKSGKLFSVLTKSAQGQILTFEQWLHSLKKCQQPTVLSKPAEWLAKVWVLLPNFYTFKYKDSSNGTEKEYIARGVPAIKKCWQQLESEDDEKIEVGVLDTLCCYIPWLDASDAMLISAKRVQLMKERLPKTAAKAAAKQKGKQVKETSEKKAKDAAMAFLKKKSSA
eukprot:312256-Amphidinium_carterae.3